MLPELIDVPGNCSELNSWDQLVPIVNTDRWQKIRDDALFVEHFGFCKYFPGEQDQFRAEEYYRYQKSVIHKIRQTDGENRTIFVFVSEKYLSETIRLIGFVPQNALFVPTLGSFAVIYNRGLFRLDHDYGASLFYALNKVLTRAEVCGEYGDGCVSGLKTTLERFGILTRRDESCIYYTNDENG
jgi:hypothetical protein